MVYVWLISDLFFEFFFLFIKNVDKKELSIIYLIMKEVTIMQILGV